MYIESILIAHIKFDDSIFVISCISHLNLVLIKLAYIKYNPPRSHVEQPYTKQQYIRTNYQINPNTELYREKIKKIENNKN